MKAIHNARFERRVLAALGIALDGVFDTLEASRCAHGPDVLGGHRLAMVCEREPGASLDESEETSNWSRRPLDAEILLALHERFIALGVATIDAEGGN